MSDVTITPSEDGPCIITGDVTLVVPDGHEIEHPDPMVMCHCGHSSNKPFCDGTRATIGFDGTLANRPRRLACRSAPCQRAARKRPFSRRPNAYR
jgi:CDGSH-type Zn-finger protein